MQASQADATTDAAAARLPIRTISRLFGVSHSGYYDWLGWLTTSILAAQPQLSWPLERRKRSVGEVLLTPTFVRRAAPHSPGAPF
jgi:cytochrome P450